MSFMTFPDFSEEKMAAFIDGMLSSDEMTAFQDEINSNPVMKSILSDIQEDISEVGITAIDDYPNFRPEETMGQIIPLVENRFIIDDSVASAFDDMVIPPPLFDDDICLGGEERLDTIQTEPGDHGALGNGFLDTTDNLGTQ